MMMSDNISKFQDMSVLIGSDSTERIVSVEALDDAVQIWTRDKDGCLSNHYEQMYPWFIVDYPTFSDAMHCEEVILEGHHPMRHLLMFPSMTELSRRLSCISQYRNIDESQESSNSVLLHSSPERQFLTLSGKTLFKGMMPSDVVRMQIDIETEGLHRDSCKIIAISIGDNRGFLEVLTGDEREILSRFVEIVNLRDPDILEGHNIYRFDLPFIEARAKMCDVVLSIGRDGSSLKSISNRSHSIMIGGSNLPFVRFHVFGRHILDTYIAVRRQDEYSQKLKSYGLKSVARAYGISCEDRVEIPYEEMVSTLIHDRSKFIDYARHDIIETARLSDIVTPFIFFSSQIVPDTLESLAIRDQVSYIDDILIREYLAQRHSIPIHKVHSDYKQSRRYFVNTGLAHRVVVAEFNDIQSEIMIAEKIRPSDDTLDAFQRVLISLKGISDGLCGIEWLRGVSHHARKMTGSMTHYLCHNYTHFSDINAKRLLDRMIKVAIGESVDEMERAGCRAIMADINNVYFELPHGIDDENSESALLNMVSSSQKYIKITRKDRWKSAIFLKDMISVMGEDGSISWKGRKLLSEGEEEYFVRFIDAMVKQVIHGNIHEAMKTYDEAIKEITSEHGSKSLIVNRMSVILNSIKEIANEIK